ncbi:MAG: hypothetical protein LBK53_01250 [Heliobacteriaceae bacterium]|jgi:glutamate--cysteine ligase|nr:hypothetical protein [Heliobacteriaceae bacterium]
MSKTKEKLSPKDITDIFTSGCKREKNIGIEYERLLISSETNTAADYDLSVCSLLRIFAKEDNWDYITDDYNIIGLKQEHDAITLEPGAQLELSLKPETNICDAEKKITSFDKKLKPVLERLGLKMLNYGISPVSTHKNIKIIPKRRYHLMAKYLWGILSDVMMRETAGLQVCIDFCDEPDAVRKFSIANKLSPFMTAMFANSPIRGGADTGYKSFRALSWLNTDNDRCGFAGGLEGEFSFNEYIDRVMKTPLIFINRGEAAAPVNGKINFEEFMNYGWNGIEAELDDFILHANLYFPEVRLRNFIEIRNHDCAGHGLQYSIAAIYKGIMYNETALADAEELLSVFSAKDFAEFRFNVPRSAMDFKLKKYEVCEIAKEILRIAEKALSGSVDYKYLEHIKEYTMDGISPADVILRNWYGSWNKDINKLTAYVEN